MDQRDFCSLVCPGVQHDECLSDLLTHPSLSRSGSSPKLETSSSELDVPYIPRNVIKPEVYDLIAAWEANAKSQGPDSTFSHEIMDDFLSSEMPMAPPKNFYLTSWRRVVMRACRKSKDSRALNLSGDLCY